MPKLCFREGTFLYLPRRELLILDQHARSRAKQHNCGERHSLCLLCALLGGMISIELAERPQDPDFILPAPLTREQARLWTPPARGVDTAPPPNLAGCHTPSIRC